MVFFFFSGWIKDIMIEWMKFVSQRSGRYYVRISLSICMILKKKKYCDDHFSLRGFGHNMSRLFI